MDELLEASERLLSEWYGTRQGASWESRLFFLRDAIGELRTEVEIQRKRIEHDEDEAVRRRVEQP